MNRAQAAMFDHTDIAIAPSGAMSPVDTSSGTTMSTSPSISSGNDPGRGGGTRFSPRSTTTARRCSGATTASMWWSWIDVSGRTGGRSAGRGAVRGSVRTPVRALAPAVDGEQR